MHANFADWYRRASIAPNADVLEKRWAAIDALIEEPSREVVVRALRVLTLPRSVPESELAGDFISAFKKTDAAFSTRDATEELRILAGAFVHAVIESSEDSDESDVAALGLVAGAFGERDSLMPNADHLVRARQYVYERGRNSRTASTPPPIRHNPSPLDPEQLKAVQAACQQNNGSLMVEALPTLLKALNGQIAALGQSLFTQNALLHERLNTQDEELKLLWWLQTGVSRELGLPFSAVGPSASVVLASEISNLVVRVPGPTFATDLLVQALASAGDAETKHTISEAIGETSPEWRSKLIADFDNATIGALCPMHLAAASSLEVDPGADWHPYFQKRCEISLTEPYSSLQLAAQLYNEKCFLKGMQ